MAELFVSRSLIEGLRLGAALRHSVVAAGLLEGFASRLRRHMGNWITAQRLGAAYRFGCVPARRSGRFPRLRPRARFTFKRQSLFLVSQCCPGSSHRQ